MKMMKVMTMTRRDKLDNEDDESNDHDETS